MSLLGTSWITSLLGYVVLFLTWINQMFIEQGIPKTGKEWVAFALGNVTGLIGVFAKDWNKSNAVNPTAVAKPVN